MLAKEKKKSMYIKNAYRVETPACYLLSFVASAQFSASISTVCERKSGIKADIFMKDLLPRYTHASFSPKPLKIGSISIKYQHSQQ